MLRVENLVKHFPITQGVLFQRQVGAVQAVDGITFELQKGETLGLVGESGCGKSTTGRLIIGLEQPTSGRVLWEGRDISTLSRDEVNVFRRDVQMIFQDPYSSLNPRLKVGEIIAEPMEVHKIGTGNGRAEKVRELLEVVGLDSSHVDRYPHEFSGGQRQRIGIARALSVNPKLIICDEPVSALDVSVQAQVINLLQDLQDEFGLTYLFIAHDLAVVKHMSDRVAVMYLGKIVELAHKTELYSDPQHPYTEALISAIPVPQPGMATERVILRGDTPSPIDPPQGCRFHTRCRYAEDICKSEPPKLVDIGKGHYCACHL
jgi:oligopeptide transport system ATP-binding protein